MDVARSTKLRGRRTSIRSQRRPAARRRRRLPPPHVVIFVTRASSCVLLLLLLGISTLPHAAVAAYSFHRPPSTPLLSVGRSNVVDRCGSIGTSPIPRLPYSYSYSSRPTLTTHRGIFGRARGPDLRTGQQQQHHPSSGTLFAARRRGSWDDLDDDISGERSGRRRGSGYFRDSYGVDGGYRMREEDRLSDRHYHREYDDDHDWDDDYDWADGDGVDDDDEAVEQERVVEWETCPNSNAQVLLPPTRWDPADGPSGSQRRRRRPSPPRAVLHFVGGTGYGALPLSLTYGQFLERLCLEGDFAIVNTPPLSSLEELISPFDHRRVAERARERFDRAFETVVEDEYGKGVFKGEDKGVVPIVAVGHSLGSRVQLIMQMMDDFEFDDSDFDDEGRRVTGRRGRENEEEENYRVEEWRDVRGRRRSPGSDETRKGETASSAVEDDRRRRSRSRSPSRSTGRAGAGAGTADGMVLISFNNFEATRSVPGLYELGSWSRRALESLLMARNDGRRQRQRRRRNNGQRRDEWGDGVQRRRRSYFDRDDFRHEDSYGEGRSGRRERGRGRRRRRQRQFYDDDYDDFDDWNVLLEEKFGQISDAVSDRLERFASDAMNLEFHPSPRELVSAVRKRRRQGSFPGHLADRTLLVQFDRDEIDQSASLARAMLDSESESASASSSTGKRRDDDAGNGGGGGGETTRRGVKYGGGESGVLGLRFARLGGDHLTPIRGVSSLLDFDGEEDGDDYYDDDDDEDYIRNGRTRRDDGRSRRGRNGYKSGKDDVPVSSSGRRRSGREEEMDDLVSSIVRYVEMVVIGETADDFGSAKARGL